MKNLPGQLYNIFTQSEWLNWVILIVIASGYTYLGLTSYPEAQTSTCVFKNVTGIPCPGCGMGRSTWLLLRGYWQESLFMHPLSIALNLLFLLSLILVTRDIIRKDDWLIRLLKHRWPKWLFALFTVVVLSQWFWSLWNFFH